MTNLLKFALSFFMVFTMFFPVSAEGTDASPLNIACDAYELAWINDSGGFDQVGCYSTFQEAKAAMVPCPIQALTR